jgi:hypothetical protein
VLQAVQGQGAQAGITASGAPLVRIVQSTRRSVDGKKLEALYPDVYNEVMKETTVEKLDIL